MKVLDEDMVKKLEEIVSSCSDLGAKIRFYGAIGNEERRLELARLFVQGAMDKFRYSEGYGGPCHTPLSDAIELGLPDSEIRDLAERISSTTLEKEIYDILMEVVDSGYLEVSAEKKEEWALTHLYTIMTQSSYYIMDNRECFMEEYVKFLKRRAEGLPEEKVKEVAEKAYAFLDKKGIHYPTATLAHLFLSQEQSDEQVKKVIAGDIKRGILKDLEPLFERCNTPQSIRERYFLLSNQNMFTTCYSPEEFSSEEARNFIKRTGIPREFVREKYNSAYQDNLENGNFQDALDLRKAHPKMIDDNKISIKELTILVDLVKE